MGQLIAEFLGGYVPFHILDVDRTRFNLYTTGNVIPCAVEAYTRALIHLVGSLACTPFSTTHGINKMLGAECAS